MPIEPRNHQHGGDFPHGNAPLDTSTVVDHWKTGHSHFFAPETRRDMRRRRN